MILSCNYHKLAIFEVEDMSVEFCAITVCNASRNTHHATFFEINDADHNSFSDA